MYPGEGKGDELTPALTPVVCGGMAGKAVSVPMEKVSRVHCRGRDTVAVHNQKTNSDMGCYCQ